MKPDSKLAARPTFDERDLPEVLDQIAEVLRSGRLILGQHTAALEDEFAKYVGVKHAVAVSSCSAALEIALRSVGVEGREVIVPTNTFIATADSILRAGGEVVVCGTDERDFCLDVEHAISLLTEKVAAVVVVHIAGFIPHGIDSLVKECHDRGIAVIEDCAHAHGATINGRAAGSLGDIGCFSFYPTKIMTCGVGGMLTTDKDDVAALARSLRHHGQGRSLEEIVNHGNDWLMDEMRAVLARAQLRRLDEVVAHRRAIAARYDELLVGPIAAPGVKASYYKYPVVLPLSTDRDGVRRGMQRFGIETGSVYWPPIHLQPTFKGVKGYCLSRAERLLKRQICLPMHAGVDVEDCGEIVEALTTCMYEART